MDLLPHASLLLDVFDDDASTIYVLDRDLRIAFVNRAWERFAAENGATFRSHDWLGRCVLDATPPPLRPFYEQLSTSAAQQRAAVEHDYECSSPTTCRLFRMRVLPVDAGAFVVIHSLVRTWGAPEAAGPALEELYRDRHGIIVQCSHCRRVRRATAAEKWEWVPSFVARIPPRTSHGLCALCDAYYYPELEPRELAAG